MQQMKNLTKIDIHALIGKDSPIILDVGSYDGNDSKLLNELFAGDPLFFCFEPDPRSIALFKKLNSHNCNLYLHEFALTNVNGTIDFYLSDSETRRHYQDQQSWSASSSIKKPKFHLELFPDVTFREKTKVESLRLDDWYAVKLSRSKAIIDFVWADVNGGEEDFVMGGVHTLNACTRYLYIEVSDKELYEGEATRQRILDLLPNFEIVDTFNDLGNFCNILLKNKTL